VKAEVFDSVLVNLGLFSWELCILLPIKEKGGGESLPYNPPELEEVRVTVTLHPVFPNPYMLWGLIPTEAKVCTCLELKDESFLHLPGSTEPTHLCFPMGKSHGKRDN
jgi:hypothetical protein